jgi:phosphoribosylformimino-5-aminoimidazole carboxamide ribotide isomerase
VIVTSWLFEGANLDYERLHHLSSVVSPERLVIDLSCRKRDGRYHVVTNRWQTFTDAVLTPQLFDSLARYCDEFLVHGVDVEGLCQGIDLELVELLSGCCPLTVTYAGGARTMDDLIRVTDVGRGRVHLTIGSALDIFGGSGVKYRDAVAYNNSLAP